MARYVRLRTIIESSPNADYSNAQKWQLEDTWSSVDLFHFDGVVTDAAMTVAISNQFTSIDKVVVLNDHASVAFQLTITVDGSAITMDLAAGEWAIFDDISDANLTLNGDAAASHAQIWAWGT